MPCKDYTGRQFGMLTAVRRSTVKNKGGEFRWEFICDCGNVVVRSVHDVRKADVFNKSVASCGCVFYHGFSGTLIYRIWLGMKTRCYNEKCSEYMHYGGRGIRVCERWLKSASAFIEDMGPTYCDGMSLDRIDNDGWYTPENCKWSSIVDQNRNRRNTIRVEFPGYGMMTIKEASDVSGVGYHTIRMRIVRGFPPERWLEPVKERKKKNG